MADLYTVTSGAAAIDYSLVVAGATRRDSIVAGSRTYSSAAGGYFYNPGPGYAASYWPRDVLYMLEGGATISATDQRTMLDWLLSKQLTSLQNGTHPAGSLPDHIQNNGTPIWGPGDTAGWWGALNNRPSMDTNVCVQQLAWRYGLARSWDATWQAWFTANASKLVAAYNAIPRSGDLVTQYATSPATTWGFLDCVNLSGASIGCTVLSCNAARALSDMYGRVGDTVNAATWAATATSVQAAIQATYTPTGFLSWTEGGNADVASPDLTGYAITSGILTAQQAQDASDWLYGYYAADKAAGGVGTLFTFASGCRGGVRQRAGGYWPTMFYNFTMGTYQNGGYWYYSTGWNAATLAVKHAAAASEFVAGAITDMLANGNRPYERADYGTTLVNSQYNASATAITSQAAMQSLVAQAVNDHVALTWSDNATGESEWILERRVAS